MAQDRVDILYLKNGEILKGKLQSFERNESISFVLLSGDTIRSEGNTLDLIKGLRMGKKNRQGYHQKTEGFWNVYEFGANFENEGGATFFPQGAVNATWGYQWGRMKKLGLGTGIEAMEDFNVLPVVISVRGDWLEGKVTPYHFFNIGYGIASARAYAGDNGRYGDVNGGFRLNPGLGVKIHGPKTFITLSAGYLMQNVNYQQTLWGGWWMDSSGIAETSRSFRRMSFRLGIGF